MLCQTTQVCVCMACHYWILGWSQARCSWNGALRIKDAAACVITRGSEKRALQCFGQHNDQWTGPCELHSYLASAGIDGVKVDVQNILETLGAGHGGRVLLARKYQQALEASVARNFPDNGIIYA